MQLAAAAALGAVWVGRLLRTGEGYRLRDKVVLITGGSRGLGLALAREMAARGARLAICGLIPSRWNGLALRWPARVRRP